MLRGARLRVGDSSLDCLVLDTSAEGARISMDGPIALPAEVTLELRSGAMWRAVPRWQRGNETGLEFVRFAGLAAEAALSASRLYGRLRNCAIHDVLDELAQQRHFEHPDLAAAAARAKDAVAALEACLLGSTSRG